MMPDFQAQIDELRERLDLLSSSSGLPRDVETAIRERIKQPVFASFVIDFPSTNPISRQTVIVSMPQAIVGDPVILGVPDAVNSNNIDYKAWVSTNGSVTVALDNNNAVGNYNPASALFVIALLKQ